MKILQEKHGFLDNNQWRENIVDMEESKTNHILKVFLSISFKTFDHIQYIELY